MIRAIVIDDEKRGRTVLQQLLSKHCPEVEIVATAENGTEGLKVIEEFQPQLVFLDIEMPGMSGFELLNALPEINFDIIFTTAYNQYAVKAIRFSAFDYLLKPIVASDLKNAMERLQKKLQPQQQKENFELFFQNLKNLKTPFTKITLATTEGLLILPVADIIYCRAEGSYTVFFLKNKEKVMASKGLGEYEELLADHHFFRIHHSHLINLDEVKKYVKGEGGSVIMSNGEELDVSKRRKETFMEKLTSI